MSNRTHAPTLAREERLQLADLLDQVGPDAPTLCEGWTTRDLTAHLVVREGHPAAAGIRLRPLAGWTLRTMTNLAQRDYSELVERFRCGPPRYSAMRLPGAEAALSTFEHYVHHEDVRRASPSLTRRTLHRPGQAVLWGQFTRRARWYLRGAPLSVRLVAPDHGVIQVGSGAVELTLTGEPGELVLHAHGRRAHADVDIAGSDHAVVAWNNHALHV